MCLVAANVVFLYWRGLTALPKSGIDWPLRGRGKTGETKGGKVKESDDSDKSGRRKHTFLSLNKFPITALPILPAVSVLLPVPVLLPVAVQCDAVRQLTSVQCIWLQPYQYYQQYQYYCQYQYSAMQWGNSRLRNASSLRAFNSVSSWRNSDWWAAVSCSACSSAACFSCWISLIRASRCFTDSSTHAVNTLSVLHRSLQSDDRFKCTEE